MIYSKTLFMLGECNTILSAYTKYSITCIQRPLKGSNEIGPLQQVVFKCRFYQVKLRRVVVLEQWSLNPYPIEKF